VATTVDETIFDPQPTLSCDWPNKAIAAMRRLTAIWQRMSATEVFRGAR
jgi:hypothetical protein